MAITTTEARRRLFPLIQEVNDNAIAVEISSQSGKTAVLISLDEYNSLKETEYLLRSPENARRLLRSLESARKGKAAERALVDE